jgi:hypothetical protein
MSPFDGLDNEILHEILGYLSSEDLGEVSQVCSRFRDARLDPSLPQDDRTAVLRLSRRWTDEPFQSLVERLFRALNRMAAAAVPSTGTPKFDLFRRLKVEGFHLLFRPYHGHMFRRLSHDRLREISQARVPQVVALDLSFDPNTSGQAWNSPWDSRFNIDCMPTLDAWGTIFPNVRELDASSWSSIYPTLLEVLYPRLLAAPSWNRFNRSEWILEAFRQRLEKLTIRDNFALWFTNHEADAKCHNLTDVTMDGTIIYGDILAYLREILPPTLERLSIKGVRVIPRRQRTINEAVDNSRRSGEAAPVPQNVLVELVARLGSNLRWFRSDLTPENVAILQEEHPDVTFAS